MDSAQTPHEDDPGLDKDLTTEEKCSDVDKRHPDSEMAQKNSNIDVPGTEQAVSLPNESLQNDSLSSTSKIPTLKPYIVDNKVNTNSQRRRRTRYRPDPTLLHFDHIFGSNNWSRFLLLKTESVIDAAKLENILLTKCPSRDMSLRQIDENTWLVETTNKRQSEIYQDITSLENVKVEVTKHDKLNSIYGTVVLPHHEDSTDKNLLLDSLKKRYSNVEDLEVYHIFQRGDRNTTLKIAKIKFEGENLPTDIRIMGQRREVRPHVPKPLQCKRCCKFGHSVNNCRNDPVCAYCGSSEHPTRWNCGESRCINCGQQHHARSKECVFYIYNTELKLLMDRTGMGVKEAKLELQVRGIRDPTRNPQYRTVVKSLHQKTENQTMKGDGNGETVEQQTKIDKNDIINENIVLEQEGDMNIESNKGIKRTRREDTSPKGKPPKSKTLKCVTDLKKSSGKTTSLSDPDNMTQDISSSPEYPTSSSNPFAIFSSGTPLERYSSVLSLEEQYFDAPLELQNSGASLGEHYIQAQVHAPDISASTSATPANVDGSDKERSQLTSEHDKNSGAVRKTNRNAPKVNRTSLKR